MKNFEEIVSSEEKVLIKFGADWCGPCKIMDKVLGGMITEGVSNIYKISVDEFPEIARKYAIRNLPTILIFQKGVVVEKLLGIRNQDELIEILK